MQAAFYGVGAVVVGIITIAAYKLARLTMAKDRLQWLIFAVMAVVTAWTESEIVWLFLLCGLTAVVVHAPPAWLKRSVPACLAVAATPDVLAQILWFFAKAGAVVFGSGLAIVPFLYGGVVQESSAIWWRRFPARWSPPSACSCPSTCSSSSPSPGSIGSARTRR
jgi:chromate transporter